MGLLALNHKAALRDLLAGNEQARLVIPLVWKDAIPNTQAAANFMKRVVE